MDLNQGNENDTENTHLPENRDKNTVFSPTDNPEAGKQWGSLGHTTLYYPAASIFHLANWTPIMVLFMGIFCCLSLQAFLPAVFSNLVDVIFDLNLTQAIQARQFDNETQRSALKFIIILTQTLGFGGVAFWIAWLAKEPLRMLGLDKLPNPQHLILAILITLTSLPLIQFTMIDKDSINLPDSWQILEDFLLKQESSTQDYLTELLKVNLPFNIFFIAVIPGIMEELFFRGMVQNNLQKRFNPHIAIWLTGFIFSLFHLQIFGFIPRMLLGVMFGYLYLWSGSILPNILGHFANNALSAVIAYYTFNKMPTIDALSESYQPPLIVVAGSGCIVALLCYLYTHLEQGFNNKLKQVD